MSKTVMRLEADHKHTTPLLCPAAGCPSVRRARVIIAYVRARDLTAQLGGGTGSVAGVQ
jgi:hypothetical protein